MNKLELVSKIQTCFSDESYPGDNDLTVHPLGLDEVFYESIKGKKWHELDADFLYYHHDCMGVLTPNGFRYYLPAFLIADLAGDSPIFDSLLYWLCNCPKGGGSPILNISGVQWFNERLALFSQKQKECIVHYFNFNKELEFSFDNKIREINEVISHIESI